MDRPLGAGRGLEEVLARATADPAFRAELVAGRERAALAAGILLGPTEIALLRATPAKQLEALGAVPIRRRGLLESAATAAVVLGTVGFAACGGARAQMPPPHLLEPAPAEAPEAEAAEPVVQDAGATPEQPSVLQGVRN
ncbi:MAG: hypothetical protein HYY06_22255 [Deltaproteobacteria bacterium]|nr:hypothetical protein [Deltaproteobacteria bacterium]